MFIEGHAGVLIYYGMHSRRDSSKKMKNKNRDSERDRDRELHREYIARLSSFRDCVRFSMGQEYLDVIKI